MALVAAGCSGATTTSTPSGSPASSSARAASGASARPSTAPSPASTRSDTAAASSPRLATGATAGRANDEAGLRRLLDRRAQALADGDAGAWIATLGAQASPALRSAQAQAFTNLRRLPVTDFGYTSVGPVSATDRVRVEGRFSLAGYWTGTRTFTQVLTVQPPSAPGQRWGIVGVAEGPGRRQVWQLPHLQVAAGDRVLVAGNVAQKELQAYQRLTQQAVDAVSSVWDDGWSGHVVVVVPNSVADFRTLSGLGTGSARRGVADVAAVTVGPVATGVPAAADEVVVNPDAYAELRPDGRRVVVLHEVTHVATRATTTADVPLWLSEGFAEYVAWSTVPVPTGQVAPDVLQRVRAGVGPTALPDRAMFEDSTATATRAYHEAWLYCRYLADRFGRDQLVAYYRAAAQPGADDADTRAAGAAIRVLGVPQQRLVGDWVTWLDDLARQGA